MRRVLTALLTVLAMLVAIPASAGQADLADVRRETAKHHQVSNVETAGYVEFLDCFDSEAGGMGQHYVDLGALDGIVEATHPEAMVYEIREDGRLQLVAVEYIVPNVAPPAGRLSPPRLFGQDFHLNESLNVWVLHAWIWKSNPAGMFEDWNPNVGACP
jgi:hypothetical protein